MLSLLNRITVNSVSTVSAAFSIAHSFLFDNSNNVFSVPNAQLESFFDGTSDFTIFALVKIDSLASSSGIIGNNDGSGDRTLTLSVFTDGRIIFQTKELGGSVKSFNSSPGDVVAGSWALLTISIDKSNSANNRIYVNADSKTISANTLPTTFVTNTGDYAFGSKRVSTIQDPMDGNMAMIGGVSRTVTQQEVTDVYADGKVLDLNEYFGNDCFMYMNADNSNDTAQFTWTDSINSITATSIGMIDSDKTTDSAYSDPIPVIEDNFDDNFINSVVYSIESGYNKRAGGAEWKFDYEGVDLKMKFKVLQIQRIVILIDGVYLQDFLTINDTTLHSILLPVGTKEVTIVEGAPTIVGGVLKSSWLTEIHTETSKFTKINETNVSKKLVFLGDSITMGGGSSIPTVDGWAHQYKYTDGEEVTTLGWNGLQLSEIASTVGEVNDTVSWIVDAFSNVTTDKTFILAVGTNDFGLSSLPAATFKGYYEDLVDAINLADSSINIICISPLLRSTDAALLDDYRTAISDVVVARPSFTTYIDGKPIVPLIRMPDGLHPDNLGHTIYHDGTDTVILNA